VVRGHGQLEQVGDVLDRWVDGCKMLQRKIVK
jgi:hypothetical protein